MVTSSVGQSSSTIRRMSPRQMRSVLRRRRENSAGPLSPPLSRRAVPAAVSSPALRRVVPTSLPLPTSTRNLPCVSSITVSLPRAFASELVAASREDAASSPVTVAASDRDTEAAGDDVTALSAGL